MLKRRIAKAVFLLALVVFVSAALAFKYGAWLTGQAPPSDSEARISAILTSAGFEAGDWGGDPLTVSSYAGDCDVYVMLPSYTGDHQDVIRQVSVGYDLVFQFGGRDYATQPGLETRFHYYWVRLADALGFGEARSLLLAVISNPACPSVPLDALRKLTE